MIIISIIHVCEAENGLSQQSNNLGSQEHDNMVTEGRVLRETEAVCKDAYHIVGISSHIIVQLPCCIMNRE